MKRGASKLRAAAAELKRLGSANARAEGQAANVLYELRTLPSKEALGLRSEVAETTSVFRQGAFQPYTRPLFS